MLESHSCMSSLLRQHLFTQKSIFCYLWVSKVENVKVNQELFLKWKWTSNRNIFILYNLDHPKLNDTGLEGLRMGQYMIAKGKLCSKSTMRKILKSFWILKKRTTKWMGQAGCNVWWWKEADFRSIVLYFL